MKLMKRLVRFNSKKIIWPRLSPSFKFSKSFFYWFVPFIFLSLAILILLVLNYNFKNQALVSKIISPAKIINVAESFSAQLYFNNEFGTTEFSDVIIKALDQAKSKIEVAVYSLDHQPIREALYRAANRGVKVTLILSDKELEGHNRVFKDLPANIERLDVKGMTVNSNFSGSMHHKFILIDRGIETEKLFFGAYNFTFLQEKYDPSFLMETRRSEIIKIFGEEFDRIYQLAKGKKIAKEDYSPFAALINYPEGYLEIWFCPQLGSGGLRDRLLGLIREANSNLEVMIWHLTDNVVAKELAIKALNKTKVKILTDDFNFLNKDSAFPVLIALKKQTTSNNLEILTDLNRNQEIKEKFKEPNLNSFLHHHLLLVDSKIALFGTNNWSSNGFFNNNESAMVTNIPSIFNAFKSAFEVNYEKAK